MKNPSSIIIQCILLILLISSCESSIVPQSSLNNEDSITTETPNRPTHPMDNPNWIPPVGPAEELEIDYWLSSGQKLLRKQLAKNNPNMNVAKNIIIVIGDGLSLATQMATRVYLGNENVELSFEKLPYTGLAKTYCVNYQVPDSSCTATAILGGVKSNYGTISVGAKVPLRSCSAHSDASENVDSIFKFAQDAGKRSGIVTTSRITHATPACAFAHSAARYWENANEILDQPCVDIASQLVHGEVGSRLNVVLGGGRREFMPRTAGGSRDDDRNLIEEWLLSKRAQQTRSKYVDNKEEFLSVDVSEVDYLMGLFQLSHLSYVLEEASAFEPSLKDMAIKALDMLTSKNKNGDDDEGFILLIEAARIDHGHHDNLGRMALEETAEMHRMVEAVMERVNLDDTLVIVTSDHSHTLTVGGYPPRGTDILGKGDFSRLDDMPVFTLSYANGMSYFKHVEEKTGARRDPLGMDYRDKWFMQPATVPLEDETHGGDDVAVFAAGPFAHLFTGLYEQHFIAHGMMYAACLGRPGGEEGEGEVLRHENCPSGSEKWELFNYKWIVALLSLNLISIGNVL